MAWAAPRLGNSRPCGGSSHPAGRPVRTLSGGACCAHRGGSNSKAADLYTLLGVDRDASQDELKAAFRRRAKQLHPDVAKAEDADEAFMQVKDAYDLLSDPHRRADYDRTLVSRRRINFFQDPPVPKGAYGDDFGSPWSWSAARPGDVDEEDAHGEDDFERSMAGARAGRPPRWAPSRDDGNDGPGEARGDGGRSQQRRPFGWSDFGGGSGERVGRQVGGDDWPGDSNLGGAGGRGGSDDEGGYTGGRPPSDTEVDDAQRQAERMEELMRLMQRLGPDGLMRLQRGMDPWGSSSSDAWAQRVSQQMRDPRFGGRGRPAGSSPSGDDWGATPEWTAPGRGRTGEDDFDAGARRPGWAPPGRDEWRPPGARPPPPDDDERGFSSNTRPTRRWSDDNGFGGKPL